MVQSQGILFCHGISDKRPQSFECSDNIIGRHARAFREIEDRKRGFLMEKFVGEDEFPVVAVADKAHVGQWFFRRSGLALNASEEVRETDQQIAVPLSLMRR